MKMVNKKKDFILYIFSFIVSVLVFILMISFVSSITLLNRNFVMNIQEKTNFSTNVQKEIDKELTALGDASGFSIEAFEGAISKDELKSDYKAFYNGVFDGKSSIIKPSRVEKQYYDKLTGFLDKNNVSVDTETNEAIKTLSNSASKVYVSHIEGDILSILARFVPKLFNMVLVLIGVSFVLIISFIAYMFYIDKKRAKDYILYALSGAGLMSIALGSVLLISRKIEYVGIQLKSLYMVIVESVNLTSVYLMVGGIVLIVLSLVLMFINTRKSEYGTL
jgi:hypothetical protein